ncbi:MAG: transposase, partial [Sandaracinaceae bacterium]|nr:transposase [Sandaracinaceae bacterium]
MRADALAHAFCIATDATGFAVQPGARDGPRKPCRKGHYFVQFADRDHILFEFSAKHTSQVVRALFRGFEGYVQADAASVYDALFRPSGEEDDDGKERREVGCWSHARRKYWEAAFAKEPVAREALLRIGKVFALDASSAASDARRPRSPSSDASTWPPSSRSSSPSPSASTSASATSGARSAAPWATPC